MTLILPNLPGVLINHIMGYYTDIQNPVWIPNITNRDTLVYTVNKNHEKYDKIHVMLKRKQWDPPSLRSMIIHYNDITITKTVWIMTLKNDYYDTIFYSIDLEGDNKTHSLLNFKKLSNRPYFAGGNHYDKDSYSKIQDYRAHIAPSFYFYDMQEFWLSDPISKKEYLKNNGCFEEEKGLLIFM